MNESETVLPSFNPEAFGSSGLVFSSIDPANVVAVIFALVFIWWFIYTLVAGYHWLRFGMASWVAVPAMAAHLGVSAWLLFYATSGFH